MSNSPTASAYEWEVTSGGSSPKVYELAVFANQIFNTEVGFRTVYRKKGESEWLFLTEPSIFDGDDFDAKTDEILSEISSKVKTFFLLDDSTDPVPETLFERVELLIRSGILWDSGSNSLTKTK